MGGAPPPPLGCAPQGLKIGHFSSPQASPILARGSAQRRVGGLRPLRSYRGSGICEGRVTDSRMERVRDIRDGGTPELEAAPRTRTGGNAGGVSMSRGEWE